MSSTDTKRLQEQAGAQKEANLNTKIKEDPEGKFIDGSISSPSEIFRNNITNFGPVDDQQEINEQNKNNQNKNNHSSPDSTPRPSSGPQK